MSEKPNLDAFYTRHSQAEYKSYAETVASEDPQAPFDADKQITPDLTEKGLDLAKEKAAEFFGQLNPETDILFFASSNEARALETAAIYRQEAKARGFELIKPENPRSDLADSLGEGEIRVVNNLSVNARNVLLSCVFNPERTLPPINWSAIDEDTKAKWEQARAIVNADDQGSWGSNFHAHSEEIKAIFPDVESTQDAYEGKFQNMLRLLEWANRKVGESQLDKQVKILAFGHENSMMLAMEQYFAEHGVKNCETVQFSIDEDNQITAQFRGKNVSVAPIASDNA